MAEHQDIGPVSVLCEVRDVRRRDFDADLPRHAQASGDAEAAAFLARVNALAAATRHRDGRRRMAKQLQDAGVQVGRATARRVMNQAGVAVPHPRRRGPMPTDRRHH